MTRESLHIDISSKVIHPIRILGLDDVQEHIGLLHHVRFALLRGGVTTG